MTEFVYQSIETYLIMFLVFSIVTIIGFIVLGLIMIDCNKIDKEKD